MVKVYYKGSTGQIIDFASENFKMLKETDLLSHKWNYSNNDYVAKIDSFSMEFVSRGFEVSVMAKNRADYEAALKRINDVFEYDVMNLSIGRLYVGDSYIRCYVTECGLETFDRHKNRVIKPYTIVAENGLWIKEALYSFRNTSATMYSDDDGNLDYPHDYPYDFASSMNTKQIVNGSIVNSDVKITVFGACSNPVITIGGHAYEVDVDVNTGEYLEINSVTKKCVKTKVNGEKVSCFNARNRDSYIYEQIKPGINTVIRNGSYGIDITIFEYRSEPEWWI